GRHDARRGRSSHAAGRMNVHQGATMTSDETRDTCELVSSQHHNRSRRLLAIVTGCGMRVKRWALRGSLLMVLCAGLVPVLATGSASALTRGFDIHNWTGQALTVSQLEINGDMPQFEGPALQQGSVLPPGGKVHVEL